MTSRSGPPSGRRGPWRRFERLLLGAAMGVAAFIIERRVLRSVGGTGTSRWPAKDARTLEPTASDGMVEVELDPREAAGDR